jgi:hypothetical protein
MQYAAMVYTDAVMRPSKTVSHIFVFATQLFTDMI